MELTDHKPSTFPASASQSVGITSVSHHPGSSTEKKLAAGHAAEVFRSL